MKRLAVILVSVALLLHGLAWGQTQTTPELLNSGSWAGYGAVSNSNQTWDQLYGCCSGGPGALLLTNPQYGTGQIHFSWGTSSVIQAIAINQALQGTGIQVMGYNWAWTVSNGGAGQLTATVTTRDNQDMVVHSFSQSYNNQVIDNVRFSGTQTYANPYSLSSLNSLVLEFTGSDGLFWAGYYGPTVRNPSLTLNYTVDQCAANPLSSPTCPNYQQAQCNISPLFSPACPGYQIAYFDQQCAANPLYDPACPGYQQAYFDYQCSLNGLYSQSCPNYATAYASRQLLAQTQTSTTTTTSTVSTDPIIIAQSSPTTSTTSPTSVTSVTSVLVTPVPVAPTTTTAIAPTAPAPTTESRRTDAEVKSVTAGPGGAQRAAARAREAAQKNSEAKTMEQQAAGQGLQVGLMGFVPGFDAYASARITDTLGQQVQRQYTQAPVDNRSVQRQLSVGSDRLHQRMVEDQYRR